MADNDQSINNENLIERLDRHLDWIKSCDTKASIVLAMLGIFLTLFASEQSINSLKEICTGIFTNINFANILYFIMLVCSCSLFFYGGYCLVNVLIPRDKRILSEAGLHQDSLYYFETIANSSFLDFKRKILNTENSAIKNETNDIISQIYVNAKICTIKYQYLKKGILYSFSGITLAMLLYVIGIVLVQLGGFK
ncbi:hypothetical protein PDR89_09960 [Bacillus cereus group sp. Bc002]|uniref:hypothetical protein n=1 Tax=Bacillus cereus group sp. Bc002 TaxID=3018130 RepID=UPI0022E5F692|nr:hypothetical protein [Bacillus cereus group sp. Bc002]MDA2779785.1 hypothetical protein [Bacillus cereus group sp. Bc002]